MVQHMPSVLDPVPGTASGDGDEVGWRKSRKEKERGKKEGRGSLMCPCDRVTSACKEYVE